MYPLLLDILKAILISIMTEDKIVERCCGLGSTIAKFHDVYAGFLLCSVSTLNEIFPLQFKLLLYQQECYGHVSKKEHTTLPTHRRSNILSSSQSI